MKVAISANDPGNAGRGEGEKGHPASRMPWTIQNSHFSGNANTVDAAVALSSTEKLNNATPLGGYGKPNSLNYTQATGKSVSVRQSVKKYGRTTRLTTGTVTAINATVRVCYDSSCSLIATFRNQIAIGYKGFSSAGDSGSLIVTNDSNAYPIGLLFAGGTAVTFANPIDTVLKSFNMSIDGKYGYRW